MAWSASCPHISAEGISPLRPSAQLSTQAAARRLAEFRTQILAGKSSFEALAKEHSEDGSAPSGGDLGWASAGAFVPEFEEAMGKLQPGGISPPIESRFGVHLIQVVERRSVAADPRQSEVLLFGFFLSNTLSFIIA